MATVTYQYDPGQTVWVITTTQSAHKTCPSSVQTGVVSYVRVNITEIPGASPIVPPEILYGILLEDDNGPTTFLEIDVFVTLNDATTEYESRLAPGSP